MIYLEKIIPLSEDYLWAMKILEISFPKSERRDDNDQLMAMTNEDYNFCLICDGNLRIGVVGFWETDDFIYLENFCIDLEHRNRGYGSQTLELLKKTNKLFILEIEPPIDEISKRRCDFYRRNGMAINSYDHIQPHYRCSDADLHLVVMSYLKPLTEKQYYGFRKYLDENIDIR